MTLLHFQLIAASTSLCEMSHGATHVGVDFSVLRCSFIGGVIQQPFWTRQFLGHSLSLRWKLNPGIAAAGTVCRVSDHDVGTLHQHAAAFQALGKDLELFRAEHEIAAEADLMGFRTHEDPGMNVPFPDVVFYLDQHG